MARRYLYAAQVNLAQREWEEGNVGRAVELLDAQRPRAGRRGQDLRGFEWRYLWRLCQGEALLTLQGHARAVTGIAFSPDGGRLATCGADRAIRVWEIGPGGAWRREGGVLRGHTAAARLAHFSPDGRWLLSAGEDRTLRLWDLATGQLIGIIVGDAPVLSGGRQPISRRSRSAASTVRAEQAFFRD